MATIGGGGPVSALQRLFPPVILASSQATITFSPIPSGYSALRLVLQGRGDASSISVNVNMQFNGDSGTDYDGEYSYGVGASVTAVDVTNQTSAIAGFIAGGTAPSGAAGNFDLLIPNYTGTTFRKTFLGGAGLTNADTSTGHVTYQLYGEWKSTAAITSLTLAPASGNFVAGTRACLYGML